MNEGWEQRWHPLRREWVVYSAHRNHRPWVGRTEEAVAVELEYDPSCYLCPRNERAGGYRNPDYDGIFIFDNDHPVVAAHAPPVENIGFYRRGRADGLARVICYHPRHDLSLTQMRRR